MTSDDQLIERLRSLAAPADLTLPPAVHLAELGRRRRRIRRTVTSASVVALTAVVATLVALDLLGASGKAAHLRVIASPSAGPADPSRTVDGMAPLACGGAGPLSALFAAPGAEREHTPEAAELRHLIATGIAGGEYKPPKTGWVVVGRTGTEVTFGRRVGAVGIDDTIVVKHDGAGYTFARSGGCGSIGFADGRQAALVYGYRVRNGALSVEWTGGGCDDGSAPLVKTTESRSAITVLLLPPPPQNLPPHDFCVGGGSAVWTEVPLRSPVGNRKVIDVGYLPSLPIIKAPGSE
ncbi:MAG TPA: hypothetical protein VHX15_17920 [Frankiaceae bacterium]|jgi:hypothetical protein|nr:hypothetical protein [Frankiaceae bacterium]